MNIPKDLKYTDDHEWVRVEGNVATIGVTDYAQQELGDVVYVDITELDEDLNQKDVFGSVEAVKTVADLFMPVSGKVIALNEDLESSPEKVNDDPYGAGWMIKIEMSNPSELDSLLDAASYEGSIE
ncbi:glycine cleavage system protein GcvH [Hyphobacterium sp. CCMP332]|nr:glycine cleavage system protein GcvH [Hyphobacterium sp. CCMP332]